MAAIHYTARAKDNRTMELPEEAQALGLKPGDEVHIFVSQNGVERTEPHSDEER